MGCARQGWRMAGRLGGRVQKKLGGRCWLGKLGRWRATLLAVVSAVAGAKAKTALSLPPPSKSPPIPTSRPTPETPAGWRHYVEQWRRGIPAAPPAQPSIKKYKCVDINQFNMYIFSIEINGG